MRSTPAAGPAHAPTRVLFLSGALGRGHDALAAACSAALADIGVESRTVDCLDLMGDRSSRAGAWVFRRLVASPLYDSIHFGPLRHESGVRRWADRSAVARMRPRLSAEVDAFDPDVLVPVFATGVAAAGELKRAGRSRPVVVFLPDAVAHRLWVDDDVDVFLVTSTLAAASVRRYRPEADVRVVAPPVPTAFRSPPSQAAARAALGLPADAPVVLLMAGAWGIGPLDDIAASLAGAGYWVAVVGGTNGPLVRRLEAVAARSRTVVPFGYTDRVPELMAASDVVVTTSGATCSEARAVGRGLVLLDVIPGHGRENLLHQLELGGAAVAPSTPEGVTRAVRAYLDHPERWAAADPGPAGGDGGFVEALASVGLRQPGGERDARRPGARGAVA